MQASSQEFLIAWQCQRGSTMNKNKERKEQLPQSTPSLKLEIQVHQEQKQQTSSSAVSCMLQ